jgi:glycosyltransferase involved in cell wall biosynthesis
LKIGVITNARAAGQRSMIGYGELVLEAARATGAEVFEWRGVSLGSGSERARRGQAKLVGQIERFVLTPLALAGRRANITHVIDPGNAIYLDATRQDASIVTVHDVIPYLCLRGELSGFRPSTTGRWLMRRILQRLRRVDRIVCVSEATRRDLLRIANIDPARVCVIHNAVFHRIEAVPPRICLRLRAELGLPKDAPVLLHIGRNFYKNRAIVVQAFARLRARRPDAHLLLVGALTPDLE